MKNIERLLSDYDEDRGEKLIVVRETDLDELEQQRDKLIDALYEYAGVCIPDSGYTLVDVYDSSSTGCITCPQADRACKFLREELKEKS